MAELIDVFNGVVRGQNWDKITEEDKIKYFFIMNRYFSKKYVEQAQFLNLKNIDKVLGLELWKEFMKKEPYPKWFWSKSESKDKPIVPPKEYLKLLKIFNIKPQDLDYLIENHYDFIKEELAYLKKLEAQ